jgi:hypothetical protein
VADDLERLRSIGYLRTRGQAQVKKLVEEGKSRGYEVEYRDGRVEAVVRPEPVKKSFSISGERDAS